MVNMHFVPSKYTMEKLKKYSDKIKSKLKESEEKDINDTFKSPFSQDQNLSEEGSGLDIEGGILQNYKKVSGQTVEEIMEGDFFRAKRDLQKSAANFFNLSTSNEKDMMNATKNFTMRHRLNKDLDFTDDFRKKFITKEYGNYEKYDQN